MDLVELQQEERISALSVRPLSLFGNGLVVELFDSR
jgi:hypothetical protein